MKKKLKYFSFFIFHFSFFIASAQSNYTDTQREIARNATQQLAGDTSLQFGYAGIIVQDAVTGEILCRHNDTKSVIPASNLKIVTTSVGMAILGSDYRFKTELQYDGMIKDSVLYGNLYLKGYGDPTLGSPTFDTTMNMKKVLDSLTTIIKNKLAVKKIEGKIVGDASAWSDETAVPTWPFEDIGNYFGAGPSGLTFNENQFKLTFQQQLEIGTRPYMNSISPYVPEFDLQNNTTSIDGGGDNVNIFSMPYTKTGFVNGTLPIGSRNIDVFGAVPDPALFTAWHLRKSLTDSGIVVTDSATTQRKHQLQGFVPPTRTTFFTWSSEDLKKIIAYTNHESNNLCAETILRAIAFKQTGIADNDKGITEILKYLKEHGIDTRGLFLQDGSGLSPRNGISAYQVAQILRISSSEFAGTLPRPGEKGTLKNFLKNYPSLSTRLSAKSGTIRRVKSYSGYLTTLGGRNLVFSVIANNFTCSQSEIRKKLEIFLGALGEI